MAHVTLDPHSLPVHRGSGTEADLGGTCHPATAWTYPAGRDECPLFLVVPGRPAFESPGPTPKRHDAATTLGIRCGSDPNVSQGGREWWWWWWWWERELGRGRGWGGEQTCAEMPPTRMLGSGSLSGTSRLVVSIRVYAHKCPLPGEHIPSDTFMNLSVCMFWYTFWCSVEPQPPELGGGGGGMAAARVLDGGMTAVCIPGLGLLDTFLHTVSICFQDYRLAVTPS